MNDYKSITPMNGKGQSHGYVERYDDYLTGARLYLRCVYKHGEPWGYNEWHDFGKETRFFIR